MPSPGEKAARCGFKAVYYLFLGVVTWIVAYVLITTADDPQADAYFSHLPPESAATVYYSSALTFRIVADGFFIAALSCGFAAAIYSIYSLSSSNANKV